MPLMLTCTDELTAQVFCKGVLYGTATTTDNTQTTVITVPIPNDSIIKINAIIKGRRTDVAGSAWVRHNAASFYNNGGTMAQSGVTTTLSTEGTGGAAAFTVSGTNALLRVTGTMGQTWEWKAYITYF